MREGDWHNLEISALKIHLDTDLGGDIDDLCALAMLLRWSGIEITAITTAAEEKGKRAGFVRRVLSLENREEIPVAAGADSPLKHPYPDEEKYWGCRVAPSPNSLDEALLLLKQSIEQGATIVGVGPFTNLNLLEKRHSGILKKAKLFLMGGSMFPSRKGFPQWNAADDYNIQVDVQSAEFVIENSNPTLVPLSITGETALRKSSLKKLKRAGALGQLLARQTEAFAVDENYEEKFGETCDELPNDIINFQHDPLTCAIALGWNDGVEISEVPLKIELRDGLIRQTIDADGKPTRIATKIDGTKFGEFWINTVAGIT